MRSKADGSGTAKGGAASEVSRSPSDRGYKSEELYSALMHLRSALTMPFSRSRIARLRGQIERQSALLRQAEAKLNEVHIFERASIAAGMGVWQCELPSEQLKWSHGTYDLFGIQRNAPLKRSEIVGSYDEESLTRLHAVRAAAIASGTGFTLDAAIRTPDAKVRWIRISATVERSKGEPIRIFGIKQDITEEKLCRDRFEYLASHDAMTGLANRVQFEAQLENVCTRGDSESVLMLVDLDDFKRVNDTFGHLVGDDCLVEAARRLTATCHSAHLIARIGGDEFALLFASSSNRHAVERTAWHLVDVMNSPIVCRGHIITLGASVGLASATHQETSAIFGRADRALYAAKAAGGRSACWYHDMYPGREAY